MTIESELTPSTPIHKINSVEQLETFIEDTCQSDTSYLNYFPTMSYLSEQLKKSLEGIQEIKEKSESLQELATNISSCIERIYKYQEDAAPPKEKNEVINTVSQTLSEFNEKLGKEKPETNLEDDFMLLETDTNDVVHQESQAPVDQSSLLYSLYDNTCDASRTVSLRLYGYLFGQNVEDVIEKPNKIPDEYIYTIKSLIENLGGRLSTRETVDFLDALSNSKVYQDQAEFLAVALCNKKTIEQRKPSDLVEHYLKGAWVQNSIQNKGSPPCDLLFIPFVYKGSELLDMLPYVDSGHIVLLTVCFSSKTVEYYDSFAYPPESWTCYDNFNMQEELEKIRTLCFGKDQGTVLISTVKQQHDWHSCGVFAIWYIVQRLNKLPFEKIASMEVTASEIEHVRTELAKLLASPKKMNKKIDLEFHNSL